MATADHRALADVALSEENDRLIDENLKLRALLADIGIDYEYKHPNSALLPRIRKLLGEWPKLHTD